MKSFLLWVLRGLKWLFSFLKGFVAGGLDLINEIVSFFCEMFVLGILSALFLIPFPVTTMYIVIVLCGEWVDNPEYLHDWFQGLGGGAALGFCLFFAWCFFYFGLWYEYVVGEMMGDEPFGPHFGSCSVKSFLWSLGGSLIFVAMAWGTGLGDWLVLVFGLAFYISSLWEYVFTSVILCIIMAGLLIFLSGVWRLLRLSKRSPVRVVVKDEYDGEGMMLFVMFCLVSLLAFTLLASLLLV